MTPRGSGLQRLRIAVDEVRDLGASRTLARVQHEIRMRSGFERWAERSMVAPEVLLGHTPRRWIADVPTADPRAVADVMLPRSTETLRADTALIATEAMRGRIRCFSRWTGDFGTPIDWHLNPRTRARWNDRVHWSQALADEPRVGDVKHTWEVARFPQAYAFARAATEDPGRAAGYAEAFSSQVQGFIHANPFPLGVHWYSGQESALRLMAWSFAAATFSRLGYEMAPLAQVISRHAATAGQHLEAHLPFVRALIYNNHLLADSLGLYLAARLLPDSVTTARWKAIALSDFDEQADRQVYRDGAYIQESFNYHRVALHYYLWASLLRRSETGHVPDAWLAAMERSLDFLVAHQNPVDGRLPNHGANDGAHPHLLSACELPDFRPTLQTLSLLTRGERIYPPGPWDEESAWLLGPDALVGAPLREPSRRSVSFAFTGYHVLRGTDARTFGSFRCGTLRDRFSQMDMLQLSVFWRGHEVAMDGGSYQYNAAEDWHSHFMSTASHNTLTVDGRDQMLQIRRFKCLYPTRAALVSFENGVERTQCRGEHYGFQRDGLDVIHQRSVLLANDDLWVVVDHLVGTGTHRARLHWLCGAFDANHEAPHRIALATPDGPFSLSVFDAHGAPWACTVVSGGEAPIRGWQSRFYGEKIAVPSMAATHEGPVPHTWVTIMGAGTPTVVAESGHWSVQAGQSSVQFTLREGAIELAS